MSKLVSKLAFSRLVRGCVVPALCVGAGLGIAQDGFAQSLMEKQLYAKENTALQENVAATKEACGSEISIEFDWAGVAAADLEKYSANSYCAETLSALSTVCADELGKAAVKEKVKSVVCKFGGTGKRGAAIADGKLSYTIDWEASNNYDFLKDFLLKNL